MLISLCNKTAVKDDFSLCRGEGCQGEKIALCEGEEEEKENNIGERMIRVISKLCLEALERSQNEMQILVSPGAFGGVTLAPMGI